MAQIADNWVVEGNVTATGTVSGSGNTSGANLTTTGNLTVGGTAAITGTTTAGQLTITNLAQTPQVVAATGTTVGAAAALTSALVFVTTTTVSTRGVILPVITTALLGRTITVVVPQTLNIKVYPNTGAHIGTAATNAAKAVTGLKGDIFFAKDTTHWWTLVGA